MNVQPCGCSFTWKEIFFCGFHGAAQPLFEFAKFARDHSNDPGVVAEAKAVIAKVTKTEETPHA